jgi:hypothetical protein
MPLTVEERKARKREQDKIYSAKYREKHKEGTRETSRKAAKNSRDYKRSIINSIKNIPCTDCGIKYPPYVMDFDHVKGQKEFNIGSKYHGRSVDKLILEIEKCEIVCANCHRIRTHERRTNS